MHTISKKRDKLNRISCVYYITGLTQRDWKTLGIRTQFKQQTLGNVAHLWLPRGGPCEDAPEKSLGKTQQEGSPGKHENPRLEAHPETDTRRGELVPAPHPSKSSAEEHERASAEHARSLRTWSAPTGDEHCDAVQRERERAGSLGVTGARLATPKRTSKEGGTGISEGRMRTRRLFPSGASSPLSFTERC